MFKKIKIKLFTVRLFCYGRYVKARHFHQILFFKSLFIISVLASAINNLSSKISEPVWDLPVFNVLIVCILSFFTSHQQISCKKKALQKTAFITHARYTACPSQAHPTPPPPPLFLSACAEHLPPREEREHGSTLVTRCHLLLPALSNRQADNAACIVNIWLGPTSARQSSLTRNDSSYWTASAPIPCQ